ncbi:MAG: VanZ family protein [Defluviitaleaceae bacterium]|nr:VanZ family protein [Defluviitaleaceae bacterium]
MNTYYFPIQTAIITVILLAQFLTIPYAVFQYKKYGAVSFYKAFLLFSFVFYMLCAYYLVILPLPSREVLAQQNVSYADMVNLVPFSFVINFFSRSGFDPFNPSTFFPALRSNVFIQPFFNVVLTIPFGMYFSYYLRGFLGKKLKLRTIVVFSFSLSLFFELTQLSGLYGFYQRPYRVFDIDDLLLNTFGGVIGFLVYKRFSKYLPSRRKLEERQFQKSLKVSYTRRAVAFLIDYTIVGVLTGVVEHLLGANPQHENTNLLHVFIFVALLFVYYTIFQIYFSSTIGEKLVNIKLEVKSTKRRANNVTLRAFLFVFLMLISQLLRFFIETTYENGIYALLYLMFHLLLATHFLVVSRIKKNYVFYERLSNTHYVTIKTKETNPRLV